jgi:hypothetical protein
MTDRQQVRGPVRPRRGAVPVVAVVLAVLGALAGCTSSKSASAPTTTGASSSGGASSATSSAAAAGSADEQAIRTAYTNFLNPASSVDKSVSLLQDGEAFRSTLSQATTESLAKSAGVTVSKVTLDSPNKATVVYTILLGGSPVLTNSTGYAVRENGTWKVSGATFCALLTLQITPPPACSLAAATSVPE